MWDSCINDFVWNLACLKTSIYKILVMGYFVNDVLWIVNHLILLTYWGFFIIHGFLIFVGEFKFSKKYKFYIGFDANFKYSAKSNIHEKLVPTEINEFTVPVFCYFRSWRWNGRFLSQIKVQVQCFCILYIIQLFRPTHLEYIANYEGIDFEMYCDRNRNEKFFCQWGRGTKKNTT